MPTRQELLAAIKKAESNNDTQGAMVLAGLLQKQIQMPTSLFTTPEPKKEQAGLSGSFFDAAATLGLVDEMAAFAANPSDENRKKFLKAAESKYEYSGGFGGDKGLIGNWNALMELVGGSLGSLAAPIVAGFVGSLATPATGAAAAASTLGTQYSIENLKRQAEEQERAIAEGRKPKDVSVGQAAMGAAVQTALDYAGMRMFRPLFNKFPGLGKLFGEADEAAVKETGQALEEAIRTGKYEITKGGVFKGVGKGVAIEMPQEIAQQAIERWNAGLSLTDVEAQEEYKQAAIGAALLGGPMGGAGAALEQRANKALAGKKLAGEKAAKEALDDQEAAKLAEEERAAEEADRAAEAAYGVKVAQEKKEADEKLRLQQEEAVAKDTAETGEIKRMLAADEQKAAEAEKLKLAQEVAAKDFAETNEIERMLAEDEQLRQQKAAELETLKAESDLETVDLKRDAARQLATENKRRSILIPLIENADPSYAEALPEAFSTALKRAGFKDTTITESEQNLLGRAIGALTATKPPLEQIPTTPDAAQNQLMEAAATRVKQPQAPGQMSFPGMGKKRITKPAAAPVEEVLAPKPITEEFLDELKIPKTAPLRKGKASIIGKDLNSPEVQTILRAYATNEIVEANNKESSVRVKRALDINRTLQKQEGVPETQMDLFTAAPVEEAVTPAPVKEAVAPAPVEKAVAPAPVEKAVAPAPVEKAVAPAPVEKAVAPAPVKEAVAPEVVEGAEEDIARPASLIPVKPTVGEVVFDNPPQAQVARVGEIMNGDIRATPVSGKASTPKGTSYRAKNLEPQAYTVHKGASGEVIHRITYDDGSIRTVAFNKSGVEIARELTPAQNTTPLRIVANAVDNTAVNLDDATVKALASGNLATALDTVSKDKNYARSLRTIAKVLGRFTGTTKVEVVDNLTDAEGKPVAGIFDPVTNTIKLDSTTGMNSHVLMHELTHAVVSATVDNPNHPLTKKLTKLYSEVRPALRGANGGLNLQEFVAEAFTNPSFQQELSSILPKGSEFSAFERFINAIANFVRGLLGMPHKQQGIRSMDDLTRTIMELMAPAPESRNAGELFMTDFSTAQKQIDDAISAVPDIQSSQAKSSLKLFGEIAGKAFDVVFGNLVSLPVLTEFAKKYIPKADELYKNINLQEGDRKKIREQGDKTLHKVRAWFAKDPALTERRVKEFGVLINFSTLNQVDLRLNEKEAGARYRDDQNKLDVWDRLRQIYDSSLIGDEGRALYDEVFNSYKWLEDAYKGNIKEVLKESGASEEVTASVIKRLEDKIRELGVVEPYAKLWRRFGPYRLSFYGTDPVTKRKEFFVENFSNVFSRNNRIKELEREGDASDISPWENIKDSNYKNAPPGSYVASIIQILKANNVSEEVQEDILQGYVNLLPDQAYLKSAASRKGTLGFDPDATMSLEAAFKAAAVHIPASKYKPKFNKIRTELTAFANTAQRENKPDADKIVAYIKMFDPHIDFAINPTVQGWAKIASSVGFNYGLGFSISGYVVNMFSLPTTVAPYLAGKYVNNYDSVAGAYTDVSKATARSMSVFRNGKSFGKFRTGLNAMGLEGYDFSQQNMPPKMRLFEVLHNVMRDNGQFKLNSAERELDLEGYGPNAFAKFNAMSGWFMSHSEQVLRETTLMTDYQMNLASQLKIPVSKLDAAFASGKITPAMMTKAAEGAVATVDLLNTGVMAQMNPAIGQKGFGKVALLFRKYSLNLLGNLLLLTRTAIKGSEADKRMARTQLAGIFGASTIFAGVGGAPFFGTIALLFNLFKDDDDDDLETATRKVVGEYWYGGFANYLLGSELSSRIGLSNFIFRDSYSDKTPYVYQAFEQIGGPLVGMAVSFGRGATLIGDGEIRRGMEVLMPVPILRNMSKAERFSREGAQTIAGDNIIDPISAREAIFQFMGFTPARYIQQLDKNAARYRRQTTMLEQRTKLYNKYYKALKDHDIQAMQEVRKDMAEYNKTFPEAPITPRTLRQSVKGKERRSAMNMNGFAPASKDIRQMFIEEEEEWDSVDSLWGDVFGEEE